MQPPPLLLKKTDQIHERLVFFTISEFQYYVNLTARCLADRQSVLYHEIAFNCLRPLRRTLSKEQLKAGARSTPQVFIESYT